MEVFTTLSADQSQLREQSDWSWPLYLLREARNQLGPSFPQSPLKFIVRSRVAMALFSVDRKEFC